MTATGAVVYLNFLYYICDIYVVPYDDMSRKTYSEMIIYE